MRNHLKTNLLKQAICYAIEHSSKKQYEIAREMGVDPCTVSLWKNGHKLPELPTVFALEDVVGMQIVGITIVPEQRTKFSEGYHTKHRKQ